MASILYIGGTGIISAACVRRSVAEGHDVTVLNRGTARRPLPESVRVIEADVRDANAVRTALAGSQFDVVADFLSFTPGHVRTALDLFEGHTGQYVFISSASAYQKPPRALPVTESTPLDNPFWKYSRDKIACEDVLVAAHRERGLPVTVVRPSHTYDERALPTLGGWTDIARMRAGRPVIVHGDGTSLWTITHSDDFAVAFTGLLGNPAAIGEAFTITGAQISVCPNSVAGRSIIQLISARVSRAPQPRVTKKRAPAIFTPRSKSRIPSRSPTSQCGFGANSKRRGSPQRRISRFAEASRPTGTSGAGRFGPSRSTAFG